MTIGATHKSLGIGVATLALLGGVATAGTAHATGSVTAHSTVAAAKKCTYTKSLGYYCGYYKGNGTVRKGSKGNAVREVQALINQTTSYKPKLKVDGDFGKNTKAAVIWFQKKYHVKPYDGVVGKKTWKELRLK
ncbi:peptidoglycan-binding protein [Streptomyces sp. NPDC093064]|uniref:peptidoglycan-binding domain-containing protein n=1 Tax=unclassified Streptomyces TaxID=2593676 RepID=UPI003419F93D